MIFSTINFVLLFLPLTFLAFLLTRKLKHDYWPALVLVVASMCFYAYWDWRFVGVIIASIVLNYTFGVWINDPRIRPFHRGALFYFGVFFNLGVLFYFKYYNFFIDNLNGMLGGDFDYVHVVLPLGISFFTFQQIAYLFDVRERTVEEHNFLNYALFVSFFPQLIAGPIVHHKEMMPQFARGLHKAFNVEDLSLGLSIFIIGVFKKVVIADTIGSFASPVFDAALVGQKLYFLEAWMGALSYTFQLYFDFSAYSDMAIGLGLMFGVRLPVNFNSPYKATSIVDFWRRWHITLSRFLRDYLYIPLGGNRKGGGRKYYNIMVVMLLGGLWHGANWTFVVWGGLHGLGLLINHQWRRVFPQSGDKSAMGAWTGRILTFGFVVVCWVVFRAETLGSAVDMLKAMAGLNGVNFPVSYLARFGEFGAVLQSHGVVFNETVLFMAARDAFLLPLLLGVCWFLPNTLQWTGYIGGIQGVWPAGASWLAWRGQAYWSLIVGTVFAVSLLQMFNIGEFLYFQF